MVSEPEVSVTATGETVPERAVIDVAGLDALLHALASRGYAVVGPTVREGAIVYDEIASVADLPVGWTDSQDGGTYRLKRRNDDALFGYAVGPHSWKKYLFPPAARLWRGERDGDGFRDVTDVEQAPAFAFIGVRSCEIHAIAIQDRVFMGGEHVDPVYSARRQSAFTVAVNCGVAGGTCFCVSMETGPRATFGHDLALTELIDGEGHRFVVEVGSERGAEILAGVPHDPSSARDRGAAAAVTERTAASMGRTMETDDIKALLYRNFEHPRWDEVASRCLTCTNCTMVCPTCFCSTVEDTSDLTGATAERTRVWDSCFTLDHSYIHGGNVRLSSRSRYRQWMTHKLATWIDQFGTSGCVGCGRCITWCPVAIDITEEVRAIRETDGAGRATERGSGDGIA